MPFMKVKHCINSKLFKFHHFKIVIHFKAGLEEKPVCCRFTVSRIPGMLTYFVTTTIVLVVTGKFIPRNGKINLILIGIN